MENLLDTRDSAGLGGMKVQRYIQKMGRLLKVSDHSIIQVSITIVQS